MNAFHRIGPIAAGLLFCTCAGHAQQTQGSAGIGVVVTSPQAAHDIVHTYTIRMPAPSVHAPLVTGAPYCAGVTTERVQTLADGTHITQKSRSTKTCRDSEGRTRRESTPGSAEIVEIHDPVSGFRYILDPYNHVAHSFSPLEKSNEPARYAQEGKAVSAGAGSGPARKVASPSLPQPERPEVSTESLGTQVIEGVSVEGTKLTRTFAVGAIGNDRPIVSLTESWFSPELKVVVLSKTSDPRMGESTMKLQNIDRSEPDPALFQIPPDYQVVDENSDRVEIKVTRP